MLDRLCPEGRIRALEVRASTRGVDAGAVAALRGRVAKLLDWARWMMFDVAPPGPRTSRFWRRCWARLRSGGRTRRHRPPTRCSPIRSTRCNSLDGRGTATLHSSPHTTNHWARRGTAPSPRQAMDTASSQPISRNCRSPSSRRTKNARTAPPGIGPTISTCGPPPAAINSLTLCASSRSTGSNSCSAPTAHQSTPITQH